MLTASRAPLGGLLAIAAGLASTTACGDGPICPSEVLVVLQAPTDGSNLTRTDDVDPDTAGIQRDVTVRSNLGAGAPLTLTVTDEAGAVAVHEATADGDGDAVFAGVTFPAGALTLTASATSDCGVGEDTVEVVAVTEADCMLSLDEQPIENDYYDPIPVLNTTNDSDPELPDFQANATVRTAAGFSVEVFVLDTELGSETSVGTMTADADGEARFPVTLAQGRQVVRATCSTSGLSEASATHTLQVDTVTPTCSLTAPEEGTPVTPLFDEDGDEENGVQMRFGGLADAGDDDDVEGEPSTFFRGTQQFPGTAVAADGTAGTEGFGEFTAPGTFPVRFETQDHAGNACSGGHDVEVILDGCTIVFTAPTTLVTTDSDDDDTNGLQTDVAAEIDADCIGQTASADCGLGAVEVTVAGDGSATFADVTLAADAIAQGQATCTVEVTDADGFTTSDSGTVDYDTEAPGTPTDLVVTAPDRQSLEASWNAIVGADAYTLRYATEPFTDFENEGTEVTNIGSGTMALIEGLQPGQTYYVGVAAIDDSDNVSAPATVGPIIPVLDATGAIEPPMANDGPVGDSLQGEGFGLRIAGGDFNGDGFADVAVSAPYTAADGTVYVYLGGADGIDSSAPAVTIEGPDELAPGDFPGQFGYGLARIAWGGGDGDDLAIGAPFANSFDGGVWIFDDATLTAAAASGVTLTIDDADATILATTTGGDWFDFGGLGWSLAAGQVDAAGTGEDLIIGAPGAGGFLGGAVIVYGGSGATDLVLSDDPLVAELDGAGVHRFVNPDPATANNLLGNTVAYLGDTSAGGGAGDLGVSYFNDDPGSNPPQQVFVLRGRATVPTDALEDITLEAQDLVLELSTADTTTRFGDGLGSIADQDGDGFRDIVVTAFREQRGKAWIVEGSSTSSLAAPHVIESNAEIGYRTQITSTPDVSVYFASGYANNAIAPPQPLEGEETEAPPGADVDDDGQEDLLLAGGPFDAVQLFVWYGGQIPTGNVNSDTAQYVIDAPASFVHDYSPGQPGALTISWLGDVNADELPDICWGNYEARGADPAGGTYDTEGRIEVLWDE